MRAPSSLYKSINSGLMEQGKLLTTDFSRLNRKERMNYIQKIARLSEQEAEILQTGKLELAQADKIIENVIGTIPIPVGIATNFVINGRKFLVPMATEQSAIISAASEAAEWTLPTGGFKAYNTGSIMIGQIQVLGIKNYESARNRIFANKRKILSLANTQSSTRKAFDLRVREFKSPPMLLVELLVDVKDSMGANIVDSMCEAVAPLIESVTKGKVLLRIVSNLATERLVRAETIIIRDLIGGGNIVDGIVSACSFAEKDVFRAATHNKGILNGVSAVLLAVGNDTRAVEAGAHAFAARLGAYCPLSFWRKNSNGDLEGVAEMPMAVGITGGAVSSLPVAKVCLKILAVKKATELGEVATCVGLACNLFALYSLVTKQRMCKSKRK
jgi:hydroxymethylglutaryl-CoA reductase